jgi:hypothetical protein
VVPRLLTWRGAWLWLCGSFGRSLGSEAGFPGTEDGFLSSPEQRPTKSRPRSSASDPPLRQVALLAHPGDGADVQPDGVSKAENASSSLVEASCRLTGRLTGSIGTGSFTYTLSFASNGTVYNCTTPARADLRRDT